MKRIGLILVLFCLILTGCKNINKEQKLEGTTLPIISTPIILDLLTATPEPVTTNTMMVKKSETITEILLPTSTPVLSRQCQNITVDNSLPTQYLEGVIPFYNISTAKSNDSFFLDLATGKINFLVDEQGGDLYDGRISPNGKWLSYIEHNRVFEFDQNEKQFLITANASGIVEKKIDLASIITPEYWVVNNGWIDNEHLVLIWPGIEPIHGVNFSGVSPNRSTTVILNPFTGEWKQYKSNFDDIYTLFLDTSNWGNYHSSLTVLNSALDRAVYLSYDGIVIWNMVQQQKITVLEDEPENSFNQPVWAPDDNKFAVDLDTDKDRNLFIIEKDGKRTQLTYFQHAFDQYFEDFSWSPDSQSIAYWFYYSKDNPLNPQYDLNIINISTKEIRTFCIFQYKWKDIEPYSSPIWSPDGKYMITSAENNDDSTQSIAVLIDLANERVYKLADDVIPIGWMVSE